LREFRFPAATVTAVPDSLVVNEIYLSLQGESTFAGLPCVFVRLTGCNLRCSYCDTAYAFTAGKRRTFTQIRAEVDRLAEPYADLARAHFPKATRCLSKPAAPTISPSSTAASAASWT
jgi:hypothetical protein